MHMVDERVSVAEVNTLKLIYARILHEYFNGGAS
jgi:acetylornithine deacetylase/succinyl-diaminopimelate desuccinylase-like protein